ncbi:MAG: hypothetical protein QHH80_12375 [Anaerolineae bacterium]|jgi:hypothetical protein|nr:hypothetical protein [Anaerolineae bacterium]
MTPSTAYLLLGPLALFVVLFLLGGTRRWGATVAAAGLAVEAFACLRLPADAGVMVLEHTVALGGAARMGLAWAAGASALVALVAAFLPAHAPSAVFLLPVVSVAGAALALEPGPLSLAAMGLALPLAAWLFHGRGAEAGRGASRVLPIAAVGLCAFALADALLTRALTAEVEQTPPWATIGVLAVVGVAAFLGLFPFAAAHRGMADAGQPLAEGWASGILGPLVLVNLARAVGAHPELLTAAPAHSLVLAVALTGALLGGVFAAASDRPSRTLAYTALVGMSVLFLRMVAADGRVSATYWLGVAGYSVAVALAAIALAVVERDGLPLRITDWTGAAVGDAAAVALLMVAVLGLCGMPAGVGFWAYGGQASAMPSMPAWAQRGLVAGPLIAAIGWWRVLWTATRTPKEARAGSGRLASAALWLLAAAALATFIWPSVLLRAVSAFAAAIGSL